MPIINGRRVTNVPESGVYGSDIINEMDVEPQRRPVLVTGQGIRTIDPNRRYSKIELLNKKGEPLKVSDIPDRTKGQEESPLFSGARSALSKQIISEQVYDVAEKLFNKDDEGVDFDEGDADWFVAPRYRLPPNWSHIARTSPLLILFPTAYPAIPPIGFYLRASIPIAPNGHFYDRAYHDASKEPLARGWRWYCAFVDPPTAWRPAPVRKPGDWKKGDNLWTYLFLVNEALGSPG